jgi:hypothetical protein
MKGSLELKVTFRPASEWLEEWRDERRLAIVSRTGNASHRRMNWSPHQSKCSPWTISAEFFGSDKPFQ